MPARERYLALGTLLISILSQITDDILFLPKLSPPDSFALSQLFAPLVQMEELFPRNRLSDYMPLWQRYKLVPQLLELDIQSILALWRNGRLKSAGWDAVDVIEILERRFGSTADWVIKEIRRDYIS